MEGILLNSLDLMGVLVKTDADPEKVTVAMSAVENKLLIADKRSLQRLEGVTFCLSESLKLAISDLMKAEKNRTSVDEVKEECDSVVELAQAVFVDYLDSSNGERNQVKQVIKQEAKEQDEPINEATEDVSYGPLLKDDHDLDYANSCEDMNGQSAGSTNTGIDNNKKISNVKRFECKICGKVLATSQSLKYHVKTHIPGDDPRKGKAQCDICGRSYMHLKTHMKTHLDKNDPEQDKIKRPHTCELCGKAFGSKHTLVCHQMRFHTENETEKKPFECDICGKRFTQSGDCNRHKKMHLDDNDPDEAKIKRPFNCEKCQMSFRSAQSLKLHMNTHSDIMEKPYECEICGSRFTQMGSKNAHRRIHLADDDPEKGMAACGVCGRAFTAKGDLNKHMKTHLDENDPEQAKIKRPHTCAVCGKAFGSTQSLKKHLRNTHTADDPDKIRYDCDLCDKRSFSSAWALMNHRRKHLMDEKDRKRYQCEDCGRRFGSPAVLTIHRKTHSK